ncbi:MAG: hypothetical protein ACYDG6_06775 [Thermincolia bacterium]
MSPEEYLKTVRELPAVVTRACDGLPPGVIALNIIEAMAELKKAAEAI